MDVAAKQSDYPTRGVEMRPMGGLSEYLQAPPAPMSIDGQLDWISMQAVRLRDMAENVAVFTGAHRPDHDSPTSDVPEGALGRLESIRRTLDVVEDILISINSTNRGNS